MTDHPRCATCQHWKNHDAARLIGQPPFQGPYPHGHCEADADLYPRRATMWLDGSPHDAGIATTPDHYCPMHSALARG